MDFNLTIYDMLQRLGKGQNAIGKDENGIKYYVHIEDEGDFICKKSNSAYTRPLQLNREIMRTRWKIQQNEDCKYEFISFLSAMEMVSRGDTVRYHPLPNDYNSFILVNSEKSVTEVSQLAADIWHTSTFWRNLVSGKWSKCEGKNECEKGEWYATGIR